MRIAPTYLLLAALALAVACSHSPKTAARGDDPNRTRYYALQVLEIRDAALNAHDLDTAARAYALDAIVIDADTNQVVLHGREEIRLAHQRFLQLCPTARIEVLDRAYQEGGKIVTDRERVHCKRGVPPVDGWVRYEIHEGAIVRVLKHA